MTIKKSFGSVITAMVTPFRGNDKKQIDLDSVASLVTHLTQTGTDSLLLTGSTGEAPQLSESEKDEVISFVREI
ncbi:MAG: dihydrodipicolinate synthase family protein, partial [Pseudomonadota bacterium]|nr:dihydrodipicolinate synthase family protein [Pseudomonadota bacterium]